MTFMTRTEYAASKGWSRQYVGKLVQQQRLVLTMDGHVDVEASEQYLAMTADPARIKAGQRMQVAPSSAEAAPSATPLPATPDYQKARTRLAMAQAEMAEADVLKGKGELVEREAVDKAAFDVGRVLRDLLIALPPRLAQELSAMKDPWDVELFLSKALRSALEEAENLSAEDFESAITTTS